VEFIGEDGETVCVSFRHDSEEELSHHDAIASALAKMAPLTAYGAAFISILSANKLNTAATAASYCLNEALRSSRTAGHFVSGYPAFQNRFGIDILPKIA